jgi:hypothetical protein
MYDASNTVTHLTMRRGSTVLAIGSGVIYEKDSNHYLVTAWHNVTGRHNENYQLLDKKYLAVPDNILVGLSRNSSFGGFRMQFVLPVEDLHDTTYYYIHPLGWPRVDVVAIPLDMNHPYVHEYYAGTENHSHRMTLRQPVFGQPDLTVTSVQDCEPADKDLINSWLNLLQPTDELFIPGYPQGITDWTGNPIWKRATVASSVSPGWNNQQKFLIDCASKSGMSGAPVFHYSKHGILKAGGVTQHLGKPAAILTGIYIGRIGDTSELEAQIGVVWHRSVIDEIIDAKIQAPHSNDMQASTDTINTLLKDKFRTCLKETMLAILDPQKHPMYYVRNYVMEQINGRADPRAVLEQTVNCAKECLESGEFGDLAPEA